MSYETVVIPLITMGLMWSPEAGLVMTPLIVTVSGPALGSGWGGSAIRITESIVNDAV